MNIKFTQSEDQIHILLDQQEVTQAIRDEIVSQAASKLAALSAVRDVLLQRQRDFANTDIDQGLVADGRDMGTVVFPGAQHKFFLEASSKVRAERRFKELLQANKEVNYQQILRDEFIMQQTGENFATQRIAKKITWSI